MTIPHPSNEPHISSSPFSTSSSSSSSHKNKANPKFLRRHSTHSSSQAQPSSSSPPKSQISDALLSEIFLTFKRTHSLSPEECVFKTAYQEKKEKAIQRELRIKMRSQSCRIRRNKVVDCDDDNDAGYTGKGVRVRFFLGDDDVVDSKNKGSERSSSAKPKIKSEVPVFTSKNDDRKVNHNKPTRSRVASKLRGMTKESKSDFASNQPHTKASSDDEGGKDDDDEDEFMRRKSMPQIPLKFELKTDKIKRIVKERLDSNRRMLGLGVSHADVGDRINLRKKERKERKERKSADAANDTKPKPKSTPTPTTPIGEPLKPKNFNSFQAELEKFRLRSAFEERCRVDDLENVMEYERRWSEIESGVVYNAVQVYYELKDNEDDNEGGGEEYGLMDFINSNSNNDEVEEENEREEIETLLSYNVKPTRSNNEKMSLSTIPWLPELSELKTNGQLLMDRGEGKVEWRLLNLREDADVGEKRSKIRKEILRWHPDKFFSKYKSRLVESEVGEVRARVAECLGRIYSLKEKLEKEEE